MLACCQTTNILNGRAARLGSKGFFSPERIVISLLPGEAEKKNTKGTVKYRYDYWLLSSNLC
jgi:hypothetical protein